MLTRKTKKQIYNTVVIALLAVGLVYVCSRFIHLGVEYTDNAQVRQHITPVNTRVQGFIKKICFEEYQPVRKGDTLLVRYLAGDRRHRIPPASCSGRS